MSSNLSVNRLAKNAGGHMFFRHVKTDIANFSGIKTIYPVVSLLGIFD